MEKEITIEDRKKFLEALAKFQKEMKGEAERVGLDTEEKIVAYCKEIRSENIY